MSFAGGLAIAGAIGGLGDSIVQKAKQRREDFLLAQKMAYDREMADLAFSRQKEMATMQNDFATGRMQMQNQFSIDAEGRAQARTDATTALGAGALQEMFGGVTEAGKGYTTMVMPDGTEVRREGTRAWRNNNPGNIEFGEFAKRHGAIGTDGRFAVFPSYEAGRAAKAALLFESDSYRNLSIAQAINRYAPPSENDSGAYAATIAKAAGVSTGTRVSDLNPMQREALLTAMERVEGFRPGRTTPTGKVYEAMANPDVPSNVRGMLTEGVMAPIAGERAAAADAAKRAADMADYETKAGIDYRYDLEMAREEARLKVEGGDEWRELPSTDITDIQQRMKDEFEFDPDLADKNAANFRTFAEDILNNYTKDGKRVSVGEALRVAKDVAARDETTTGEGWFDGRKRTTQSDLYTFSGFKPEDYGLTRRSQPAAPAGNMGGLGGTAAPAEAPPKPSRPASGPPAVQSRDQLDQLIRQGVLDANSPFKAPDGSTAYVQPQDVIRARNSGG